MHGRRYVFRLYPEELTLMMACEHLRTHLCIQANGLVVFRNVDTGSESLTFEESRSFVC